MARIGQIALLPQLAARTIVPPAVWAEITVEGASAPGAAIIRQAQWIEILPVDVGAVQRLAVLVGRGEAEAIVLAQSTPGSLLLIDDARARRVAEQMKVR